MEQLFGRVFPCPQDAPFKDLQEQPQVEGKIQNCYLRLGNAKHEDQLPKSCDLW